MAAATAAQNNSSSPSYETEAQQPHDDFLEQMLSTLPNCSSWPDLPNSSSNPNHHHHHHHHHPNLNNGGGNDEAFNNDDDAGNNAAAGSVKSFLLQQQLLLSRGGDASGLIPLPLSLAGDSVDSRLLLDHHQHHHDLMADAPSFKSPPPPQGSDGSAVQALFNSFAGTLHGNGQSGANQQQQQPFQAGGGIPTTNFGISQTTAGVGNGATAGGGGNGKANAATGSASTGPAQRQRVRARRGQATDPHSIAERLRRERIAERMKALQELVPNANKTDKASMLDEIIDYVKFLQLQVKVLSMSRLGGAGAMAPLVADLTSEGGRGGGASAGLGGGGSQTDNGGGGGGGGSMEHQVAKMMEEDMGSAMQYLQGKGLCLMPISLATAISTATCSNNTASARQPAMNFPPSANAHNHLFHHLRHASTNNNNGDGPASPNLSALTVQSANGSAPVVDVHTAPLKDSKP